MLHQLHWKLVKKCLYTARLLKNLKSPPFLAIVSDRPIGITKNINRANYDTPLNSGKCIMSKLLLKFINDSIMKFGTKGQLEVSRKQRGSLRCPESYKTNPTQNCHVIIFLD